MKRPLIEACVDSYASAMAASRAGADRLELCAHLVIGGTTPTHALFRQVQRDSGVPINVLIRPRFGDFLYTEPELEEMCEEIAAFRDLGANGVVIGALTPDGELDLAQMRRMMACAGQMEVTLHRAFDMTRDPRQALEAVIRTGCRRVLTSGGRNTAQEGVGTLRALAAQAAGRIEIMAGSGVNPSNARLLAATGADALHFSARREREGAMRFRNPQVSMGGCAGVPEYSVTDADETLVRKLLAKLE